MIALAGLFLPAGGSLGAQSKAAPASTSAAIAGYTGADRLQRLIEGAKKEGEVSVYNSAPVDDMRVFTAAFEKKYGVKVKVWRASSENIVQRAVTEARAGRFDVDVAETNSPEMEALHREKLLQEVKSPYLQDLIPQAAPPHREWIGTRLNKARQSCLRRSLPINRSRPNSQLSQRAVRRATGQRRPVTL